MLTMDDYISNTYNPGKIANNESDVTTYEIDCALSVNNLEGEKIIRVPVMVNIWEGHLPEQDGRSPRAVSFQASFHFCEEYDDIEHKAMFERWLANTLNEMNNNIVCGNYEYNKQADLIIFRMCNIMGNTKTPVTNQMIKDMNAIALNAIANFWVWIGASKVQFTPKEKPYADYTQKEAIYR